MPFTFFNVAYCFRSDCFAMSRRVMLQIHWQVANRNVLSVRDHHRAFDDALQLPNVARPRIIQKQRLCRAANFLQRLLKLLAGLIDEVGDEQYDIFPSVPQGRENNACAVEAKVEIVTEALSVN